MIVQWKISLSKPKNMCFTGVFNHLPPNSANWSRWTPWQSDPASLEAMSGEALVMSCLSPSPTRCPIVRLSHVWSWFISPIYHVKHHALSRFYGHYIMLYHVVSLWGFPSPNFQPPLLGYARPGLCGIGGAWGSWTSPPKVKTQGIPSERSSFSAWKPRSRWEFF